MEDLQLLAMYKINPNCFARLYPSLHRSQPCCAFRCGSWLTRFRVGTLSPRPFGHFNLSPACSRNAQQPFCNHFRHGNGIKAVLAPANVGYDQTSCLAGNLNLLFLGNVKADQRTAHNFLTCKHCVPFGWAPAFRNGLNRG